MGNNRRPLKSLGQNFLVDQNIIAKIVQVANIQAEDHVLEIGPGRGALTHHLAERAGRLCLVEFDHVLAEYHRQQFQGDERVTVIDGDILKTDLQALLGGSSTRWKVVANLPYNISTEVLFRLLEVHNLIDTMTLMLQKEVGDRLVALPDSSEYGVTTVQLGLWYDISRAFIVPPGCFNPRPKIDSAVLSFRSLPTAKVEVGNETVFRGLIKSAFSMRRKTLSNCLKSSDYAKTLVMETVLADCEIDGRRRGETLSIEEFALLSRYVTTHLIE